MNNIINKILILFLCTVAFSCKKTYDPSTQIRDEQALSTPDALKTATIGVYAQLKDINYLNSAHYLAELPSDEVAQAQNSSSDISNVYKYTNLNTGGTAANMWRQSYFAIDAATKIIEAIPDGSTPELLQIKGENMFLRAMIHFNLVNIFGKPYVQGSGNNPGVPILKNGLTFDQKLALPRATVKEVYTFVIEELSKAADLMTEDKSNAFGTKLACYALLSRIYLYQENNAKAIESADLVINAEKYSLLQNAEYQNYFRVKPTSNRETIFCILHLPTEDKGFGSIGSIYYSGDASGNGGAQNLSGYGEIYASKKYFDFLSANAMDKRLSFISPYKINNVLQTNKKLSPNTPIYYINKYSLQEGLINLSSPVYLRLAEMYLNKAEANAKLGNTQLALDDINVIRTRAGIGSYTTANVTAAKTILDLALEERWLELAFEGHRAYDLYRNNKDVVRDYPGTQVDKNGNVNQTIKPTDAKIVNFIPLNEISKNPALTQNP